MPHVPCGASVVCKLDLVPWALHVGQGSVWGAHCMQCQHQTVPMCWLCAWSRSGPHTRASHRDNLAGHYLQQVSCAGPLPQAVCMAGPAQHGTCSICWPHSEDQHSVNDAWDAPLDWPYRLALACMDSLGPNPDQSQSKDSGLVQQGTPCNVHII